MKIVIDIPEDVKKAFDEATKDDLYGCYYDANSVVGKAIKNGTPLPKGHGRLIDADALEECKEIMNTITGESKYVVRMDDIRDMPTIIKADKEGAEE